MESGGKDLGNNYSNYSLHMGDIDAVQSSQAEKGQ